ncbi:MAG TPA: YihA family ribosome biogenesis GTP-binding protein [Desulfotomaculum sp.]|jgi:GTP-binding protein|nr:YihA family ribosome biogenesis GTP-binding protein [Desulfotomaculum sp.]
MKVVSAGFKASAIKLAQCPAGVEYEVALAGRSNVGKSSLLNKLVNRKSLARVSNTPGRTQTLNFYLINGQFFLVDLPGYGYAKAPGEIKKSWGRLVEIYLQKRKQLCGVVQIVDLRHPPTGQDNQLYEWLSHYQLSAAVVATKADKLSRSSVLKQMRSIKKTLGLTEEIPLIIFSAKTGQGKDELWQIIECWLKKERYPRL